MLHTHKRTPADMITVACNTNERVQPKRLHPFWFLPRWPRRPLPPPPPQPFNQLPNPPKRLPKKSPGWFVDRRGPGEASEKSGRKTENRQIITRANTWKQMNRNITNITGALVRTLEERIDSYCSTRKSKRTWAAVLLPQSDQAQVSGVI